MKRANDTRILGIAAVIGALLLASAAASAGTADIRLAQAATDPPRRPSAGVREACQEDIARFCADAIGPQKMKACMQGNARQLRPACRSALESAGLITN